jgi:hypothetical protein
VPEIDDDGVREIVRTDLAEAFARPADRMDGDDRERDRGTTLPPVDGARDAVELLEEFGVMRNDAAAAMAWRYTGVHSEVFLGMQPTGRLVEVEGITIVQGTADQPEVRSLIDWHSVLAQIGAVYGGRPVTRLPDDFVPPADPEPAG